jgi:predicted AAA+ superfamily ATPase
MPSFLLGDGINAEEMVTEPLTSSAKEVMIGVMTSFFDADRVYDVLRGLNPWWTEGGPAVPGFRRAAYQACRWYYDHPKLRRAVLLSGPRRVGKTTVLLQLVDALLEEGQAPESILYLSLDHPALKMATLPDLLRLYRERVHPADKDATLLLDEVQYASDWDLHIKQLVDHSPCYRIVATGSSSMEHRRRLAESGVGRWVRVPMPPLSFFEFLRIRGEADVDVTRDLRPSDLFDMSELEQARVAEKLRPLMPLFQRYLLFGGFPETARLDDVALCQRLLREDVVERALKRDVVATLGARSAEDLEKLFLYLCIHTGGILAVQTCATALGVSTPTVGAYLDALEEANLIYRLAPIALGGKKVLKARNKVYLVDAALRNAMLLKGEEVLADPQDMGLLAETVVLRHLYTYHYWDTPRLAYWRDARSGREVDIIVRSPRYVIPVEVKYRATVPLTDDEGIARYCRHEQVPRAYWVTMRERDFGVTRLADLDTAFLRVPAHIFVYLLGHAEEPADGRR